MIIATSFSTYLEETNGNFEEALALAKQDGFEAMGIVVKEQLDYYLKNKEIFLNSGLKFCIHANMIDTNISSLNEGIRNESIKQMKEAIILAKELNARIVTFHPGKFRNTLHIQDAYYLLDLAIDELQAFAEQNNVLLCLENMEPKDRELCVTLTQVKKVLERHPKLGFTLDLAHVTMLVSNEEEFMQYYNELKDRISHFHISGIKPKTSHVEVSLKESDVDFTNVLKMIKDFNGMIRIENRERKKNLESRDFIINAIKQ
jgi:sugar phosphate isomerase/epimerase